MGIGDSVDATDAQVTLREAIFAANQLDGPDMIEFGPNVTGSIVLRNGSLRITGDVTIRGPGANQLAIELSRNDPTPLSKNGDGLSAIVVEQPRRGPFIETNISGLTFQNADANVLEKIDGTIRDVVIKNNFGAGITGPNRRLRPTDEVRLVMTAGNMTQ